MFTGWVIQREKRDAPGAGEPPGLTLSACRSHTMRSSGKLDSVPTSWFAQATEVGNGKAPNGGRYHTDGEDHDAGFRLNARRPALSLPEYVAPVLAAGGPAALVFILLRFGPDAFLRLLAGTVAVLTHDKERGERCLKVLRILRNRDDDPPESSPKPAELPPRDDANL
jgi:hypothetical protein